MNINSNCYLQDTLRTDEQEVNHHGRSVSVAAGNSVQPEVENIRSRSPSG